MESAVLTEAELGVVPLRVPRPPTVLANVAYRLEPMRRLLIWSGIGGDEFAIILPATGAGEADATARRLIAALHATDPIGHPRTSISAGVAILDGLLSPGELIKHADVALYEAKRAGGDRHVISDHPIAPPVTRGRAP